MFYIQRVALRKAVCTFSITIAIKKKDFIVKIHIIPYTVDSIWKGEKSSCTLLGKCLICCVLQTKTV